MQISTLGPCEFFGEACLEKDARSAVSVVAHTTVSVFILNKWDLMKILAKEVWMQLVDATVVGSIDEATLREQFYRHDPCLSITGCISGFTTSACIALEINFQQNQVPKHDALCLQVFNPGYDQTSCNVWTG